MIRAPSICRACTCKVLWSTAVLQPQPPLSPHLSDLDDESFQRPPAPLSAGVPVDRIVYAHPCKPPAQIKFAAAHGVNMTTFDTESELLKVSTWLAFWAAPAA